MTGELKKITINLLQTLIGSHQTRKMIVTPEMIKNYRQFDKLLNEN